MNKYEAFYKGRRMTVEGSTSLEARDKATLAFKAKKAYDVTVVLAERADGTTVVHTPDF